MPQDTSDRPTNSTLTTGIPDTDAQARDGAEASLDAEALALGITRQPAETFHVGGFRYSTLSDAVAQGRRMAKRERS